MPYGVKKSEECPDSKPWACYNMDTDEIMGCHETKDAAEEQQAALYANEPGVKAMSSALIRRASAEDRERAAEVRARGAGNAAYVTRSQSGGPGRGSATRAKHPNGTSRSLAFPSEIRAKLVERNGQQRYHLHGEASVFETPYEMWDWAGPYDEIVEKTSLDASLAADPDVSFLVNHKGITMARTINNTLVLEATAQALVSDAYVNPKRTDVEDLVTAIDDKDVTEMSFAFMLLEGWWSDDFTTFRISEADINRGDVSAVNYGANPYTSIAARQQELLGELDRMGPELARVALSALLNRHDLDLDELFDRYNLTREVGAEAQSEGEAAERAGDPAANGRSVAMIEALLTD